MEQQRDLQEIRTWALKRIEETRVAGRNTRHSRADNLLSVQRLIDGHPHYTFGIHGVEHFRAEEVLDAIAGVTGCSKDPNQTVGGGYISPRATLVGLEEAARTIYDVARGGGRFVLATGHPGSLLLYYLELAPLIQQWGGRLIQEEEGAFIPPNFDLVYVGGVATVSDRCSLWHSHDTRPMELIIEAAEGIDLAVVDHGFAGAAINAGIPTVTVLDTNDPAPALARRLGANVVLIPMDDNRPLHVYPPIVGVMAEFARHHGAPAAVSADGLVAQGRVLDRLARADGLVEARTGDLGALDEIVDDFAETYKDQFIQTHFDLEREEAQASDPYLVLAIYRSLRVALDRFIFIQAAQRGLALTPDQIRAYLRSEKG